MLLFYSTQEKHKNERYQAGSRNFSLEFDDDWLKQMGIDRRSFEGGFVIEDQQTKDLFLKLMLETKSQSNETLLAIEVLAVNLLGYFSKAKSNYSTAPDWLIQIKHLLHDVPRETFSLTELAAISGVHPVTISKLFPRFFGVGVGDYIRGIKLEKSLGLLAKRHIPIETIALQCGFADHSHFCRVFKERKGITPSHYRQFLFG
jgi:AraC family transcriptional regulator